MLPLGGAPSLLRDVHQQRQILTPPFPSALIAGCGYLGNRCARSWQQSGVHVTAITRSEDRAKDFRENGLHPLLLDLSRPLQPALLPYADVVLWAVGFDRSTGVPREQIWLDGLRSFIQRMPSAPRRFVYISSTSVYGQIDGETVDEQTLPAPTTEGGECCVRAEDLARFEFGQRFPETDVIVLRMAGIYGPDRLLRRVEDLRNRTPLAGEPEHCLNLIHVDDAVRMIEFVARSEETLNTINVVNSGTVTRREYYSRLAEIVAAPPPVFGNAASSSRRQRGGNKRVTSRHDLSAAAEFQYDNVLSGLSDAVARTVLRPQ